MWGPFSNLERLRSLKRRLARNEPRKTDWGFACQDNEYELYPLGRGKPQRVMKRMVPNVPLSPSTLIASLVLASSPNPNHLPSY